MSNLKYGGLSIHQSRQTSQGFTYLYFYHTIDHLASSKILIFQLLFSIELLKIRHLTRFYFNPY